MTYNTLAKYSVSVVHLLCKDKNMQTTTIISYLDVSSTIDDIKGAVFQRAYKLIIYDAQIKKSWRQMQSQKNETVNNLTVTENRQ